MGQGRHTHKQPKSKWSSPFLEGQHGTKDECLVQYGDYLRKSGLLKAISYLRGCTLWCDCEQSTPCEADWLIAAVYGEWKSQQVKLSDGPMSRPRVQTPDGKYQTSTALVAHRPGKPALNRRGRRQLQTPAPWLHMKAAKDFANHTRARAATTWKGSDKWGDKGSLQRWIK